MAAWLGLIVITCGYVLGLFYTLPRDRTDSPASSWVTDIAHPRSVYIDYEISGPNFWPGNRTNFPGLILVCCKHGSYWNAIDRTQWSRSLACQAAFGDFLRVPFDKSRRQVNKSLSLHFRVCVARALKKPIERPFLWISVVVPPATGLRKLAKRVV
jgi:hypothetical protein